MIGSEEAKAFCTDACMLLQNLWHFGEGLTTFADGKQFPPPMKVAFGVKSLLRLPQKMSPALNSSCRPGVAWFCLVVVIMAKIINSPQKRPQLL